MDSGAVLGIVATGAVWGATEYVRHRTEARNERDRLRAQADRLLVAVVDVRAAVTTNRLLRETWQETLRTMLLAAGAFMGGYAGAAGPTNRRILSGVGRAAELAERERRDHRAAASRLTALPARVVAEAGDFARHRDAAMAAATEELIAAVSNPLDQPRLAAAERAFGQAAARITQKPLPWWAWRRRRRILQ